MTDKDYREIELQVMREEEIEASLCRHLNSWVSENEIEEVHEREYLCKTVAILAASITPNRSKAIEIALAGMIYAFDQITVEDWNQDAQKGEPQ